MLCSRVRDASSCAPHTHTPISLLQPVCLSLSSVFFFLSFLPLCLILSLSSSSLSRLYLIIFDYASWVLLSALIASRPGPSSYLLSAP